jgi:hypothetical protein
MYHSYSDEPINNVKNYSEYLKSQCSLNKKDLRSLFKNTTIEKLLKTFYTVLNNENAIKHLNSCGVELSLELAKDAASSGYFIWPQKNTREDVNYYFSDFYKINDEIENIKNMLFNNIKGEDHDGTFKGLFSPVYQSTIKDFVIPEFESFVKALIACAYLVENGYKDFNSDTMHSIRNISIKILHCQKHHYDFPMWFKFNGEMIIIDPVKMTINKNPGIYDGAYITALSVVSNCNH